MSEELTKTEKQIEDILTKWFKDPIDKPCPYCEAMKKINNLIQQAQAEIAREIFEALDWEETCYESLDDESPIMRVQMSKTKLQSLESKYGGQK
jgi:hypothetical protein